MQSRRITWAIVVLFGGAGPSSAGVINDIWLGGSGVWGAPAGWSAGTPNNSGSTTYNVTVASGGGDQVTFNTNFTINSLAIGGSTGSSVVQSMPGSLSLQVGGTLTVGQTGNLSLNNGDAMTVGGSSTNAGMIQVAGVGTTLSTTGGLATSGTLIVGDGFGGAAVLNVAGNLNNSANSSFYSFSVLPGATANVGTLTNTGDLYVAGTLDLTGGGRGVTDIVAGSSIQLGTDVQESGTFNVINNGVATNALANLTQIDFNSTTGGGRLVVGNQQTLTLGSLTNLGDMQVINPNTEIELTGNLVNFGVFGSGNSEIVVGTVGVGDGFGDNSTLIVDGDVYSHLLTVYEGATLIVDGTFTNIGDLYNDGGLTIDGTACFGELVNYGTVTFGPNASLNRAGCNPLVDGALSDILSGNTNFGVFDFSGEADLGGVLNVLLGNGFTPTVGQNFDIINFAPGELSGAFTGIENDYFNDNTERWVLTYNNAGGSVYLTAEAASGTPEPTTMMLLGIGLLAIGARYGRRAKAASAVKRISH